ncbi:succinylglutamic semialdehyde dehydrogenase [Burkholderia lata]|uniref:Succinylglutamic semialdehyde dehydrogenase n=1 Tax=Burkholderia lata (strain ATCC 17760 / DSM 23089 / LMG 22485 / NCIMB 9086 / R18194 / 383) TaxID=482957 RepID=A0A6P2NWP2_BURL3|nr:succinylglutamate-semialdehyde dehydrogenase [Burkholderia lata]VWB99093.1 succinylglutamic semialdehyde dehydrogenase [Burkholderia lata]
MKSSMFNGGSHVDGHGDAFVSINPATGEIIWQGCAADGRDVSRTVSAARAACTAWRRTPQQERIAIAERFAALADEQAEPIAQAIGRETGKALWECRQEAAAVSESVRSAIRACVERQSPQDHPVAQGTEALRFRPHGVLAVYGPFNFPAFLTTAYVAPALLAGNAVIVKPSELTPSVTALVNGLWISAGLPADVLSVLQGGAATGAMLAREPSLDGLVFTGSSRVGRQLHAACAGQPEFLLALEMGGNNPLVIDDACDDLESAARYAVLASFVSAGQRCTCARRVLLPEGRRGDRLLEQIVTLTTQLDVDRYDANPQPFMGPLINVRAADTMLAHQDLLIELGGHPIEPLHRFAPDSAFLRPGVIDVTNIPHLPDEEYFGPLMQVIRYRHFDDAIRISNDTRFGLSAALISSNQANWIRFRDEIRAGVVNWNTVPCGASMRFPFGGSGRSGNHRPGAYFAIDYCAHPVTSIEHDTLPEWPAIPGWAGA